MGVEKRMDNKHIYVTLYTVQPDSILNNLKQSGYHTAKMQFIKEKYAEVAQVFVDAYKWYTHNAEKIVPRPPDAESAVWCYKDPKYIEKHEGYKILRLYVPVEKAVFFRMSDWNKRLNLRYIGKTLQEEDSYNQKLLKYGVDYEGNVYLTSFYPQLKSELIKSWQNLFRYDELVKEQGDLLFDDMQAGIWHLEWEWVQEIL
jgi:hypothetical protein